MATSHWLLLRIIRETKKISPAAKTRTLQWFKIKRGLTSSMSDFTFLPWQPTAMHTIISKDKNYSCYWHIWIKQKKHANKSVIIFYHTAFKISKFKYHFAIQCCEVARFSIATTIHIYRHRKSSTVPFWWWMHVILAYDRYQRDTVWQRTQRGDGRWYYLQTDQSSLCLYAVMDSNSRKLMSWHAPVKRQVERKAILSYHCPGQNKQSTVCPFTLKKTRGWHISCQQALPQITEHSRQQEILSLRTHCHT